MKKIVILISIFLFSISLFFSCELNLNDTKVYNNIDATNALAKLAPVFSEVLKENSGFIKKIKEEAEKRFDGDLDVLFENVENLTIEKGGKTFKALIESKLITKGESESFEELIAKIPYFNIYVFEPEVKSLNKEANENIIVCANRYDVDDMSDEYVITGYDLAGNVYEFKRGEEPDRMTLVLGVNEYLAYEDFLKLLNENGYDSSKQKNILSTSKVSLKGGWDQNTTREFYLAQLYLEDDYEAFPNGPAEVYCLLVYAKNGLSYGRRIDLPTVDNEKRVYNLNIYLQTFINEPYEGVFALYFREWDIFWAWESGKYPDQVIANLTVDTVIPPYHASYAFGCNKWDDDLRYGYKPGTNNGHIYNMPECIELDYLKFYMNGFKIKFWNSNGLIYYFGMPNATSSWYNWAKIDFFQY